MQTRDSDIVQVSLDGRRERILSREGSRLNGSKQRLLYEDRSAKNGNNDVRLTAWRRKPPQCRFHR